MATIKQLESWIASAEAKLEKKENILKKHIANLEKKEKSGADEWDIRWKKGDIERCEKEINYIKRDIEKYTEQLNEKSAAKAKEESEFDNELKSILDQKLTEDKQNFIEGAGRYAENEYDNAPSVIERCIEVMDRLEKENHRNYWYSEEYKNAQKNYNGAKYILRFSRDEYVEMNMKEAETYYEASIKNMVKKLVKFNIDKPAMKISYPNAIGRGLEMIIEDGKNRQIYARLIWAAEYSVCVAEHLRFIVTEKKLNK